METVATLSNGSMPLLGLGTYRLTGSACNPTVREALSLGYRHLDTAEYYRNETEIGTAIQGFPREELFITSKAWGDHFHKDALIQACDDSLKRLRTDYLDLYLLHFYENSVPLSETLSGLKKLLDEGKIKNAGVSNFDKAQLQEALSLADFPIAVNQVEFHPYLYQKELLAYCGHNRVHVTAYCPVARGAVLVDPVLKKIAAKHEKTPAQVSLRWLLQKGLSVIPKAASPGHLKENQDVFDWNLDSEDVKRIDGIGVRQRIVPLD